MPDPSLRIQYANCFLVSQASRRPRFPTDRSWVEVSFLVPSSIGRIKCNINRMHSDLPHNSSTRCISNPCFLQLERSFSSMRHPPSRWDGLNSWKKLQCLVHDANRSSSRLWNTNYQAVHFVLTLSCVCISVMGYHDPRCRSEEAIGSPNNPAI